MFLPLFVEQWVVGGAELPRPAKKGQQVCIRLMSLNCGGKMHGRGQDSKEKQQRLKVLVEEEGGAAVLALQHTGVASAADAKRLTRLFGSTACGLFATNAGHMNVASVALIFPQGAEDITMREAEGRWLTGEATVKGHRFAVTSVYLPAVHEEREQMLRDRQGLPDLDAKNWFIGGDWNFVLDPANKADKYGGDPESGDRGKTDFEALTLDWELVEIAGVLGKASATHLKNGGRYGSRLDRWYCSQECFNWVQESRTTPSTAYGFDHHLITTIAEPPLEEPEAEPPQKGMLTEVLQTDAYLESVGDLLDRAIGSWDKEGDCGEQLLQIQAEVVEQYGVVERKWVKAKGMQHRKRVRELQRIEQRLVLRQDGEEGDEGEYASTVSAQQSEVRRAVSQAGTERLNTRNRHLRGKSFWKQNKKRGCTNIGSLADFDDEMEQFKLEEVSTDPEVMAASAKTYFASLFRPQELRGDIQDVLVDLLDELPEELQLQLGRDVTAREIETVIRRMKKSVAPGPDGIPTELYQQHARQWSVLFTRIFNASRENGHLPTETLQGLITLLFQKGGPAPALQLQGDHAAAAQLRHPRHCHGASAAAGRDAVLLFNTAGLHPGPAARRQPLLHCRPTPPPGRVWAARARHLLRLDEVLRPDIEGVLRQVRRAHYEL